MKKSRMGNVGAVLVLSCGVFGALLPSTRAAAPASPETGEVVTGPGEPSNHTEAWPQFRGPNRDGIAPQPSAAGVLKQWPAAGPEVLWTIEGLGDGYSGAAIRDGKVYFHDYDDDADRWMARCVSLADGRDIWTWSYKRRIRRNHGVTRTVPAVTAERMVSLDPKCVLHGFDTTTGERVWAIDLVRQHGTRIPPWYNGQCPLPDGEVVIVGVGGKDVLMMAVDLATGEPVWATPNDAGHGMSHSSPMPATIDGVRQYIWCTIDGLVGVAADDGRLLWETFWSPADEESVAKLKRQAAADPNATVAPWRINVAVAPSPVAMDDGLVFMTSGYKAGTAMFRIGRGEDGVFRAETVYTLTNEQFASECQTPVVLDGKLLTVDHAADKEGRFACVDPANGSVLWRHDGATFGLGNWIIVDGVLYILEGDTGVLRMLEATTEGYRELAAAQVLKGHDVWAPIAYADGMLVIRDLGQMKCIRVGEPAKAE